MTSFYMLLCLYVLFRIDRKLSKIAHLLKRSVKSTAASLVEFYVVTGDTKRKVLFMNLKVSQKLPVSIEIKDKFGNPASVDGAPTWSLTDPSKGSLAASDDGMSAIFTPAGQVGEVMIQVSADADLGEGVKAIIGELPVTLVAGEAVSVSVSSGEPSDV